MIRLGVCGGGPWARLVHLPAVRRHPDVQLSGVWTRRPEAAEQLAADFDTSAFAGLDDLIDRSDAIAFAVPPESQPALAMRAAQAGKHLILEKPIAANSNDAFLLRRAIEDAGVASLVCFTRRWIPAYEEWLQERGAAGDASGGYVTMLSRSLTTASGFEASAWRHAKGGLWDMGPHAISIVQPVLGNIGEVFAVVGRWHEAKVLARHQGGATSILTVGISSPPTFTDVEDFGFYGARGPEQPQFTLAMSLQRCLDAQHEVLGALTRQIAGGARTHALDVRLGEHVVQVLEACERSLESGCTQPVRARYE